MPIIDTPKCNLLYSKDAESDFQLKTIKDDMLCAGFAEGKKDACKVKWCSSRGGSVLTSRPSERGLCPDGWRLDSKTPLRAPYPRNLPLGLG